MEQNATSTARIWLMLPNENSIYQVQYPVLGDDRENLKRVFPNNFKSFRVLNTDDKDYYTVFYDAEEGGAFNKSAKWIAKFVPVAPTGNFVIMHRQLRCKNTTNETDLDFDEYTVGMKGTVKEFKSLLNAQLEANQEIDRIVVNFEELVDICEDNEIIFG